MKITVSAAHGLYTPGKRSPDDSLREFMFNLAVFNYLKTGLEQYTDSKGNEVSVIGVHDQTGKKDISLAERAKQVNKINPNLHLDIHANAFGNGWNEANGIETFVYKKSLKEAVKIAESVQKELVAATGLRNRGVKEGNLHMIRETNPTAILIEGPFMTNKKEAELLKSGAFRKIFAESIAKGVANTYGLKPLKKVVEEEKPVNFPSSNTFKDEMTSLLEKAHKKGVLNSHAWIDKSKNGTLTEGDAISLIATILNRSE